MKKTLKVKEIASAYQVLSTAKFQKLSSEDKVKLWKISRMMKPIAIQFEEDFQDAKQKLMPEELLEKLQKGRLYELAKQENTELPISEEEYQKILKDYRKYLQLVDSAVKELQEKEIEIEGEFLNEEAFGKLISSNDWTLQQLEVIDFIITE